MFLEHVLRFANGLDHDGQSSVSNLGLLHFRPPLEDQAHNSANRTRKCRDSGSPRPTLAFSVELCYGIRAHIGPVIGGMFWQTTAVAAATMPLERRFVLHFRACSSSELRLAGFASSSLGAVPAEVAADSDLTRPHSGRRRLRRHHPGTDDY